MTSEQVRRKLDPIIREIGIREVARNAGVASPSISNWLNGRRGIGDDLLIRVAKAAGYTLKMKKNYSLRKK